VNPLHRRAFLQSVVGSAIALGASPLCAQSQKPKIKVGFLGAAHSHAVAKWKLMQNSADFQLLGLAEESPEVRAQFEKQGAAILSIDELLRSSEAIIIESPVRAHARHARLALRAGKHVHVEKPPAVSMPELTALVTLARESKRVLQVGYMWRYHPGFTAIFEAVRKGWLGEIFLVRAMINTFLAPDRRAEWAEFKGGGMFELGCHLIDPMIRLLGPPLGVKPTLRRDAPTVDDLKDNSVVVFEFPRALGIISNSTQQPNATAHRSFEVMGANGTAVLRPIEPPILQIDLLKPAGPYKSGAQTVALPKYERYAGDFVELAALIRAEKSPVLTLDDELLVHDALLRACDSSTE
jgi:predicted dehydrogenase